MKNSSLILTKTMFISLIVVVFAATAVDAQSSRRKRIGTPKSTTSTAQTQPVPTSEPMIISRAEDYPADGAVLSTNIENAIKSANAEDGIGNEQKIADLTDRIKSLEKSKKNDYDEKQKRLALNLDILSKAEQRAESLRKQMFDLMEKENTIKTRLELIESDIRPEMIDRTIAFAGTLRPEELRAMRRKNLEVERTNLQNLLNEIQRTRTNLELNVQKADALVEKLRNKLEADIDAALAEDPREKPF